MKVLNEIERGLLIAEVIDGNAKFVYARDEDGTVYCTIKRADPLKNFRHLFGVTNSGVVDLGLHDAATGGGL